MFATFYSRRKMTFEELREVLQLMEVQETTDKYTGALMSIKGNYADIDVKIDEDGNVILI